MKQNVRIMIVIFTISFVLSLIKFYAYFITASNAILSDAFESIVNVFAGGMAILSVRLSSKPADNEHPYGHGKIEFITSGVEGGLILMAGIFTIGHTIYDYIQQTAVTEVPIGFRLMTIAGVVNGVMAFILINKGKKSRSIAMVADGKHLASDALSSVAVIIGLGLVWLTGLRILDTITAISVGVFIIYEGYKLVRAAYAGIMDETDKKALEEILAILNEGRKPTWIDIHNMRVIRYGGNYHLDFHLTLPWYITLEEAHNQAEAIHHLLEEKLGFAIEVFIHTDHCLESSCSICMISTCAVRKKPYVKKLEWTISTIIPNKRHGV